MAKTLQYKEELGVRIIIMDKKMPTVIKKGERYKYCKYCKKEFDIDNIDHWERHKRGHLVCRKQKNKIRRFYNNPKIDIVYAYLIEKTLSKDKGYIFNALQEWQNIKRYKSEIVGKVKVR